MAKPEISASMSALSKKIDKLIVEHSRLRDVVENLKTENELLKARLETEQAALQAAYKDIEFLSLSHRLAATPEALAEARTKIARLIRTVDTCIRLIKED